MTTPDGSDSGTQPLTAYRDAPNRSITAGGVTYAYRELGPEGRRPGRLLRPPRRHPGQLGPAHHRPDRQGPPRHRLRQPRRRRLHRHRARHHRGDGRRRLRPSSRRSASTRSTSSPSRSAAWSPRPSWSSTPTWSASSSSPAPARRGGKDMDKVAGTTYYDILRADPDPVGPEGVPVLQPQRNRQARREGVRRAPQGAHRRPRRDDHGQGVPDPAEGDQALGPVDTRRPVEDHPADADRQRRQRPDGARRSSPTTCIAASRARS